MNTKRFIACFLALLFVAGVLVVPTIHTVLCAENNEPHEEASCSFCQLAHTTAMTPASQVEPTDQIITIDYIFTPQALELSTLLLGPARARAPPAC